ncbi:hypothetical protein [Jeotgalibacillus marinus]|uniref:Uncharacterized protein n=1 Tax=Jeotgalibacillus marinus TaxID=86667 RepID=A0ABV3Q7F7_9BACL
MCQKQNLPVQRLYYWLRKLLPPMEDHRKNERANWSSMNVPVTEEEIHATIRIHMKESTIELDVPFTPQVLLHVAPFYSLDIPLLIKLFYKNCTLIHKENIHFDQSFFKMDAFY